MLTAAELRRDLHAVVRGVVAILALQVLRSFSSGLPGAERPFGSLRAGDWLHVGFSVALLLLTLSLYAPVRRLAAFYLEAAVSGVRARWPQRHLAAVSELVGRIVLLIFMMLAYDQLPPLLARLGPALTGMEAAVAAIQVAALIAALLVLLDIWRTARPLLDSVSEAVADEVAGVSLPLAFSACPACGESGAANAQYCAACGVLRVPPSAPGTNCASCRQSLPAAARYCPGCGAATKTTAPA